MKFANVSHVFIPFSLNPGAEFGIKYREEYGTGDIWNKGFYNCRSKSPNKLLACAMIAECHHVIDRQAYDQFLLQSRIIDLNQRTHMAASIQIISSTPEDWTDENYLETTLLSPYPFHLEHLVPQALMWLMYAAVEFCPPSWTEMNYRSLALNWTDPISIQGGPNCPVYSQPRHYRRLLV